MTIQNHRWNDLADNYDYMSSVTCYAVRHWNTKQQSSVWHVYRKRTHQSLGIFSKEDAEFIMNRREFGTNS